MKKRASVLFDLWLALAGGKLLIVGRGRKKPSYVQARHPRGTIIALRTRMYAQFDWTLQELEEALNCCSGFCAVGEGCEVRLEGPWSVEPFDDLIIVAASGTVSISLGDVPLQRKAKVLQFSLKSQRLNSGNLALTLLGFRPYETDAPRDVAADMLLARRAKQHQEFLARATQILPPFIEPNGELAVQRDRVCVSFSSGPGLRSTAQPLSESEQASHCRRFPSEAPSSLASSPGSAGRYSMHPHSVERVRVPQYASTAPVASGHVTSSHVAAAPVRIRKQTA